MIVHERGSVFSFKIELQGKTQTQKSKLNETIAVAIVVACTQRYIHHSFHNLHTYRSIHTYIDSAVYPYVHKADFWYMCRILSNTVHTDRALYILLYAYRLGFYMVNGEYFILFLVACSNGDSNSYTKRLSLFQTFASKTTDIWVIYGSNRRSIWNSTQFDQLKNALNNFLTEFFHGNFGFHSKIYPKKWPEMGIFEKKDATSS